MNNIGLSENNLSAMIDAIKQNPKITSASIYGSRAKGDFSSHSDIDIAIYGDCDIFDAENLMSLLDELPTAYTFDVVAYNLIKNPDLREHIDRVGVVVYHYEI